MERLEETNLSRFVEGIIGCFCRETCDGCSGYKELSDEEKVKIVTKVGVGKWVVDEEEEEENNGQKKGH